LAEIRDHVQLHYLDWGGDRRPLLLLAGLGDTAYIFAELAPHLSSDFHVLALTRRGYGESDVTVDHYSIDDRVEDIRAFLDVLGIQSVVLVGHSAAGDELTGFALKYPNRVSAMVYLDAAYDRADPAAPAPDSRTWQAVAERLYGGIPEDDSYKSFALRVKAMSSLFASDYGVGWGEALDKNLRETNVVNVDGSVSPRAPGFVSQAIREGSRQRRLDLAAIKVPALLIFARGPLPDTVTLTQEQRAAVRNDEREYARYFATYVARIEKENPSLQIKILPAARHYFFLKEPQSVATWIRQFR
jgi:pimeloyl-ACP methyl ester carboxylesterase